MESARESAATSPGDGALDIPLDICNATPDIVATATAAGAPTFLNRSGRQFFGLGEADALNDDFFSQVQPEWAYRKVVDEGFAAAVAHGSWTGETALLRPDGVEVPVSQVILAHPAEGGREGFFSTILRDISAIKRAQTELVESQRMVRKVADATLDLLYILDLPTRTVLYANKRFEEMFGVSAADNLRFDFEFLEGVVHPDDLDALRHRIALVATLPDGEMLESELRVRRTDGELRWLYIRTTVFVRDEASGTFQVLNTAHDITSRKRADTDERELRRVMEHALEGMALLDLEGRYLRANPAYARICGTVPEDLVGTSWKHTVHPSDRAEMQRLYDRLLAEGRVEGECRGLRRDGSIFYKRVVMTTTHGPGGDLVGHYCFVSDVTDQRIQEMQMLQQMQALTEYSLRLETQTAELHDANRRLEDLAQTDGLTGIPNHRTMQDRLRQEFARAERERSPLSFLLLDIDHFKNYNDTNGHPLGDEVLRTVAALLVGAARTSDVVARYGGEEFALILPNTDLDAAGELAERLRVEIESHAWGRIPITTSIGVACSSQLASPSPGTLIETADKALYQAKKLGRNRVAIAPAGRRAA